MTRVTFVPADLETHAAERARAAAAMRRRLARLADRAAVYRWANPDHAADPGTVMDGLSALTDLYDTIGDQVARLATAARQLDGSLDVHGRAQVDADALAGAAGDLRRRWYGVNDLRDLLEPADPGWWTANVFPDGLAWCGPGTYTGGGAVTGSDGRRYPLVVPEVWHDGALVRGDGDGSVDVATLGGIDPGWVVDDILTGTSRVDDELTLVENIALFALGFNPTVTGRMTTRPADADVRRALRLDANGLPHLAEVDVPSGNVPGPPTAPAADPPDLPHVADGIPGTEPGHGVAVTETAGIDRAGAALDVGLGVLEGMVLVDQIDEAGEAAWQVVFEHHPDGRRRAQLRVYDLAVTDDGTVIVNPSAVSAGPDGDLDRHHLRFGRSPEPTISAAAPISGTALHLVQHPDNTP